MRIRRHYQLTVIGLFVSGCLYGADTNYCATGYFAVGINENVSLICAQPTGGSGLPSDPAACPANQWVNDQNQTGVLTCSQPAFTNISGSVTDAQVPDNITITALASKTLLVGSASLDFADPSASTCTAAQTITVTGAAVGDPVILGIPGITIAANQFIPQAWVSTANTVSVKYCEGATTTNNPAAGTFTAVVLH